MTRHLKFYFIQAEHRVSTLFFFLLISSNSLNLPKICLYKAVMELLCSKIIETTIVLLLLLLLRLLSCNCCYPPKHVGHADASLDFATQNHCSETRFEGSASEHILCFQESLFEKLERLLANEAAAQRYNPTHSVRHDGDSFRGFTNATRLAVAYKIANVTIIRGLP